MHFESLWRDIRFAFGIFRRSPAVALTVVGTLAVALGLNAVAYSFVNAYMFKPAAVRDPAALYLASWENRGGFFHRFSWVEAERFGRDMAGVFSEIYVSMPQIVTRINGRPAMGTFAASKYHPLPPQMRAARIPRAMSFKSSTRNRWPAPSRRGRRRRGNIQRSS
jgi:hypothetical protein